MSGLLSVIPLIFYPLVDNSRGSELFSRIFDWNALAHIIYATLIVSPLHRAVHRHDREQISNALMISCIMLFTGQVLGLTAIAALAPISSTALLMAFTFAGYYLYSSTIYLLVLISKNLILYFSLAYCPTISVEWCYVASSTPIILALASYIPLTTPRSVGAPCFLSPNLPKILEGVLSFAGGYGTIYILRTFYPTLADLFSMVALIVLGASNLAFRSSVNVLRRYLIARLHLESFIATQRILNVLIQISIVVFSVVYIRIFSLSNTDDALLTVALLATQFSNYFLGYFSSFTGEVRLNVAYKLLYFLTLIFTLLLDLDYSAFVVLFLFVHGSAVAFFDVFRFARLKN